MKRGKVLSLILAASMIFSQIGQYNISGAEFSDENETFSSELTTPEEDEENVFDED